MELLIEIPYAKPSRDYLFARIRCRRAGLTAAGYLQRLQTGNPRQALMAEYRWVYRQLGHRLRRELLPVFEYFELRLLVVALRYLSADDHVAMNEQLQQSLFRPQVNRVLQNSEQVVAALCNLEQLLGEDYPVFRELPGTYLRQGPGGLEQALIGGYLQGAAKRSRSKPVRQLLLYLLDMRNLQAMAKHLQWQVPSPPPLLTGGTFEPEVLIKIWNKRDRSAFQALLQKFTQQPVAFEENRLEDELLQALSVRLRRAGRDPLQLGVLIDYLWRCQLAAREQGLRLFVDRSEPVVRTAEATG